MEASENQGTGPEVDQSQAEPPAQSQEQPAQDSGLQTPQPDQPVPTDAQPQESAPDPAQAAQPTQSPSPYPSSADQNDAAVQQELERETARSEHNARTGGGEIQPNEVQNARQEHNDRTGGGQVPGADDGPDRGE